MLIVSGIQYVAAMILVFLLKRVHCRSLNIFASRQTQQIVHNRVGTRIRPIPVVQRIYPNAVYVVPDMDLISWNNLDSLLVHVAIDKDENESIFLQYVPHVVVGVSTMYAWNDVVGIHSRVRNHISNTGPTLLHIHANLV